jgi:hypothetical protein
MSEMLNLPLNDNVKTRVLKADGSYLTLQPGTGEKPSRSQEEFIKRSLPPQRVSKGAKKSYPKVKVARKPEIGVGMED